ncbi:NXPE family member 4-like [Rhinophrynus dorsalis]
MEKLIVYNFVEFVVSFRQVFDVPGHVASTSKHLMTIRQGALTVAEYIIKFHTLAAVVGSNNEALVAAISQALCDTTKDEIAAHEPPSDLDEFISFTILIDTRIRERPSFREHLSRPPSQLAPNFAHPPIPPSPAMPPSSDSIPNFEYFRSTCKQVEKKETELQKEVNKVFRKIDDSIPKVSFTHIDNTTSAKNSKATIIHPKDTYYVGDTITVQVVMFDYLGNRKMYGGDFLMARIFSPDIQASASGRVEDLKNGTYQIHFTLFWQGTVQFSILLIHPSEGVSALWKARNQGHGYVAYTGLFINKGNNAQEKCGFDLNKTQELCEYSDLKEEEYFYCKRPGNMSCGSLVKMMSVFVDSHSYLSNMEKHLFNRSNIRVEITKNFEKISVSTCRNFTQEEKQKCSPGMKYNFPNGYFNQNLWNHLSCNITRYRSMNNIIECIKGKIIYLTGDSTMLQWMTYLSNNVNSLKPFNLYTENWPMTRLFLDMEKNIKIQWRKHANPFIMLIFHTFKEEFTIPNQIDQIDGNQHTIIVFTLGMHFRLFPVEHFIRRVLNIRRAIERLLLRSPDTKIIVKTENTSEMSERVEMLSDFHGYIQYLIMNHIFQGLNIGIVDAWDMTNAFASNRIHPPNEVISNEIDMLLSYAC